MTYRFLYGVRFVWVLSLSSDTSQKNDHPSFCAEENTPTTGSKGVTFSKNGEGDRAQGNTCEEETEGPTGTEVVGLRSKFL